MLLLTCENLCSSSLRCNNLMNVLWRGICFSAACYLSWMVDTYILLSATITAIDVQPFAGPNRHYQMPPRRQEGAGGGTVGEDESTKQPQLFNIANRGLCSMSKTGKLQTAADCSIVLIGTARCPSHNIKGYIFGLKHYPSRVKEVRC